MKDLKLITGYRIFKDVVDGPGWTDVDGYYDSNGKYVPPEYCSTVKEESRDRGSTQGNKNTQER